MTMTGIGLQQVMAMRARILESNDSLRALHPPVGADNASAPVPFKTLFDNQIAEATRNARQSERAVRAYEAGETADVAAVMLARQKASVSFEATLQIRNKLLSAYRDIMNMPV